MKLDARAVEALRQAAALLDGTHGLQPATVVQLGAIVAVHLRTLAQLHCEHMRVVAGKCRYCDAHEPMPSGGALTDFEPAAVGWAGSHGGSRRPQDAPLPSARSFSERRPMSETQQHARPTPTLDDVVAAFSTPEAIEDFTAPFPPRREGQNVEEYRAGRDAFWARRRALHELAQEAVQAWFKLPPEQRPSAHSPHAALLVERIAGHYLPPDQQPPAIDAFRELQAELAKPARDGANGDPTP